MRAPTHDASVRQNSGGPSPVLGRGGDRNSRPRNPGMAELEDEIAGLVNRSTHELRLAWRRLHRTGPPLGLSRDLMIRTFANKLQERVHGGPTKLACRTRRWAPSSRWWPQCDWGLDPCRLRVLRRTAAAGAFQPIMSGS